MDVVSPKKKEWYLEYIIHQNRPGLMGDISSVLGMLRFNIITINGVDLNRRGMILESEEDARVDLLRDLLNQVTNISVTKLRPPTLRDRLAVRHGRYISRDADDKKTFRFVRDEIGLLVDFLAQLFKRDGHQLIGIRGRPRVGKTESLVAASVCANKRWFFVSSTLLKQTVCKQMSAAELSPDHVFIIDGIVSTTRAPEEHQMLLREVMSLKATKVVEHPDIFVRYTEYTLDDFHCLIELRNDEQEEIPIFPDSQQSSLNSDWG